MVQSKLEQEKAWVTLHDRISDVLDKVGTKNAFREGDYWLLDENWGWYKQQLEIQNLTLLRPEIIHQLRVLLADYPEWEITVRVDVVGKEDEWPGMGIIIRQDEVVDELQRDCLPPDFADFRYGA